MTIAEALPDPVAAELNAAPLYLELEALTAHFNLSDEIYEKLTTLSEDEVSLAGIYLFKVSDAEWLLFEEMLRDERLLAQLELIEQIAAKPFFQPDWKYEEGPAMMIMEVGEGRRAADYLLILASQAIRNGDGVAANTYLSQVVALANHFNQAPTLIAYMTGVAIRRSASDFLEEASQRVENTTIFDPDIWFSRSHDNWHLVVDSERLILGKLIFETFIDGDSDAVEQLLGGQPAPAKYQALGLTPVASYFRYDYVHYLKYFELARFAEEPFYASYALRDQEFEEAYFSEDRMHSLHVLSQILIPPCSKVREIVFRSDAQNVVNHTALILAKYYRDTGSYPEALGELVPNYLETLPIDLFNGAPLIYRNESTGFALYSIGPNMRDDGGETNDQGQADNESGDVIWAGAGSSLVRSYED